MVSYSVHMYVLTQREHGYNLEPGSTFWYIWRVPDFINIYLLTLELGVNCTYNLGSKKYTCIHVQSGARLRILVHINGLIFCTYVCTDSTQTRVQSGTRLHISVYIKGSRFHKGLLPTYNCWWQSVHLDWAKNASVHLNGVTYTTSVPSVIKNNRN